MKLIHAPFWNRVLLINTRMIKNSKAYLGNLTKRGSSVKGNLTGKSEGFRSSFKPS
jgi:hypothetical protein